MLKNNIKPVSRKSNIVVQNFDNEVLIYDLTENKAFSLNETSALVWHLCDGSKTVFDIAKNLSGKFDSPITEDFVRFALDELKKNNLLENAAEVSTDFGGLSRREVIRKVGFATLAALPAVLSLVAPAAVHAQSLNCNAAVGRSNGCVCSGANNCASGCCGNNGNSNQCVTAGQESTNSPCRAGCECMSGSCNGTTNQCR